MAALFTAAAQNNAAVKMLESAASRLAGAPSAKAEFTLPQNGGRAGSLDMSKEKFVIISPVVEAWYDGKTQWTYLPGNDEVAITTPTTMELMESNPFVIIANFKTYYNYKATGTNTVELTPKSKTSGISKVNVTMSPTTKWPSTIDVFLASGDKLTVNVTSINTSTSSPSITYRYDNRHKGAELIDLRD